MTPEQFTAARHTLAETQVSLGRLIGITDRHIRRYEAGTQKIPQPIAVLMKMLLERNASKIKRHERYQKKKASEDVWRGVERRRKERIQKRLLTD